MTILNVDRKLYRRTLAYVVMPLGVFLLAMQWFPDVVVGVVLHPALRLGIYTAMVCYLVWKGWIQKRPPEGSGPSIGG